MYLGRCGCNWVIADDGIGVPVSGDTDRPDAPCSRDMRAPVESRALVNDTNQAGWCQATVCQLSFLLADYSVIYNY